MANRADDPHDPPMDTRGDTAGRGAVTLIVGCMFSGKTTELLRRLHAAPSGAAVVVKPGIDRRYQPDRIVTHDGRSHPAQRVNYAREIPPLISDGTTLLVIDEAHFLDPSLADAVRALRRSSLAVAIAALDSDSWGRPFDTVERLRESADEVIVRNTICARCGAVADHTQRLTPIMNGNLIGGRESYEPRCAGCWRPPPEPPP